MAQYEHLPLRRLEGELPRRKRTGFPGGPKRSPKTHGAAIESEIVDLLDKHKLKPRIGDLDPSLILKVKLDAPVSEDEWEKLGLTVVGTDPSQTLILFADDNELQEFKRRVTAYQQDPPKGQKNPQYAGFIEAISEIGQIDPGDRIGPILRGEGIKDPAQFNKSEKFILDVELWLPNQEKAEIFTHRVAARLRELGGTLVSEYRGNAALLMRIEADGDAIRGILDLNEVAAIDRPPIPDLPTDDLGQVTIEDIGEIDPPDGETVVIGIVDSGVTSAHPLLQPAIVSTFGEPAELNDNDDKGHGTPVAGIATYGDIRNVLASGQFAPRFRIASARVVNSHGRFDDKSTITAQMEASIRRLHGEHGCRVINISLGDQSRRISNKPSAWAAVLDDLARELDLVIVVSAGNSDRAEMQSYGDGVVAAYPEFLLKETNRILEPASGINILAVGSIANSNGLSEEDGEFVGVQALATADQPSPFTRKGPGVRGMIKPDLVDYGGTVVFDGAIQNIVDGKNRSAAGVLSLHNLYLERLFTSVSGTSFSAPLVAYKAALIRESFPDASSNFVRALLALSADHPSSATECLEAHQNEIWNMLGYGRPDIEKALYSDDSRVVLYREDILPIDRFAVFEIPVPSVFQTTKGQRQIRVALAYDPPVRHTRLDYAGIEMSFELIRGKTEEEVFNHFRKWEKKEGKPFKVEKRFRCPMTPKSQHREKGSLQCATFKAATDIKSYGDRYYLAVRCEGGWASNIEEQQRFSVMVELRHQGTVELYERVRERVRLRA